jgi:hypothetical protein
VRGDCTARGTGEAAKRGGLRQCVWHQLGACERDAPACQCASQSAASTAASRCTSSAAGRSKAAALWQTGCVARAPESQPNKAWALQATVSSVSARAHAPAQHFVRLRRPRLASRLGVRFWVASRCAVPPALLAKAAGLSVAGLRLRGERVLLIIPAARVRRASDEARLRRQIGNAPVGRAARAASVHRSANPAHDHAHATHLRSSEYALSAIVDFLHARLRRQGAAARVSAAATKLFMPHAPPRPGL